jgi:DNA replication protein DnaC
VLDRVVHNAYRIELKGESMRKKRLPNGKIPSEEVALNK